MTVKLLDLEITASHSRIRVSNDNPYSEALFRACKYRSDFLRKSFETLLQAREWIAKFIDWYNHDHRHSAIKFVTPSERYSGKDNTILKRRLDVYQQAERDNSKRWSGKIRNWEKIDIVYLNPEKQLALKMRQLL